MSFYPSGERLAILSDEVKDSRPYGTLEKWLESKSGTWSVAMTTFVGIAVALFPALRRKLFGNISDLNHTSGMTASDTANQEDYRM